MSKVNLELEYLRRCGWVIGGNNGCRAPEFILTLRRLERLTRWLETEHRVSLPRSPLSCVSDIKRFCDDSLDLSVSHVWRSSLRDNHVGLRARSSVCATLFLFRKVVPVRKLSRNDLAKVTESYIRKMTTPSAAPPASFLSFASLVAKQEFRPGWDRGWHSAVDHFCLPVKSCLENRSGAGGARSYIHHSSMERRWRDGIEMSAIQADYLDFVEPDESSRRAVHLGPDTRVLTIRTGGKNRTVSMFSARRSFLKPLHTIMYDRLSKSEWLLRGEASVERFSDFTRTGEVIVSGDYESATDNLNLAVSQCVLRSIRENSRHVPSQVWDEAERALVNRFEDGTWQARGQLMGSLLSFPLLCLVNYISFRWSVARDVPVRINGDDIVFRASPDEALSWERGVSASGLTLSKGKTMKTKSLFSLNSNFFLARRGRVEQVAHIRSSCVWDKPDEATSVAGKLKKCEVGMPTVRNSIHVEVLRTCHRLILDSQRSVLRGLRASVHVGALRGAGLIEREAFYLSLAQEPLMPPPFKRWQDWRMSGWHSKVVSVGEDDVGATHAMVRSTWESFVTHDSISREAYRSACRNGTFRFVPLKKKYFRMLGVTECTWEEFQRKLPTDFRRLVYREREGGKRVWRRNNGWRCLSFASAGVL